MKTYWKFLTPLLLALAVAFGLFQRSHHGYLNKQPFIKPGYQNLAEDKSLRGYYEQAASLAQNSPSSTIATFLAAGDIMLSRGVAEAIKKAGDVNLPFRNMADVLKSTDFNFANLESPFVEKNAIVGGHSMQLAAPKENIAGLIGYNFKILNLANNHAMDENEYGIAFTRSYLEQNGIKGVGTYFMNDVHNDLQAIYDYAWQPAIIENNGIKIAFIGASYASVNDSGKTKLPFVARIEDLDKLKIAVTQARQSADFVVVTMHAGVEYTRTPNPAQIKFAHAAVDDGADMVIGAHAHWVQTIEKYNGKYILYSLGNFIFDQGWSQDTKEGLTLKIQISKKQIANPLTTGAATSDDLQGQRGPAKLDSIELLPVMIENYSTPRPARADEAKKILQKIGQTENILK